MVLIFLTINTILWNDEPTIVVSLVTDIKEPIAAVAWNRWWGAIPRNQKQPLCSRKQRHAEHSLRNLLGPLWLGQEAVCPLVNNKYKVKNGNETCFDPFSFPAWPAALGDTLVGLASLSLLAPSGISAIASECLVQHICRSLTGVFPELWCGAWCFQHQLWCHVPIAHKVGSLQGDILSKVLEARRS